MLGEHAEFKVVHLKDIITASDGTRKVTTIFVNFPIVRQLRCYCLTLTQVVKYYMRIFSLIINSQEVTDFVHIGRWTGY